ncbi:MAG: L,D-transpeptidase family protein [Chloroflexota bacterium]|nr:MAG: hypothetical protein DIU68_09560 [Chloroflexota bacterium]
MTNNQLHRRDFLKLVGAGAAAPALSPLMSLTEPLVPSAGEAGRRNPDRDKSTAELVEIMRRELEPLFAGREMALVFRRFADDGSESFSIQINENELYPVASAFKSFLALYYFMTFPPDEWNYTPGSLVYSTVVYSNNGTTGSLLHEVGLRVDGPGNAIEKFNDFLLNVMGLEHGLYSWNWPGRPTYGLTDPRFTPTEDRRVWIRTLSQSVSNVTTALDLAKGWEFISRASQNPRWSDPHFREAIRITREISAIPANDYRSPIEKVIYSGYIGKDGTLPLGDLAVGRVINDAGIVRVANGEYVISFMSTGENESTTQPALQKVIDCIRMYEEQFYPPGQIYITGQSHPLYEDGYNYGFVRRQNLELFSAPSEDAPRIDNPVRRNTVFGLMYLMQGALVRFLPVDDQWAKFVRDDNLDNVFTYTDWTFGFTEANWVTNPPKDIFIRISDLLVIGREHFEPIGYITGAEEGTDKFIFLDVPRRQLTLFEGTTAILKTPIVLNMAMTPRGRLYVNRVLITRNMPHYPCVPYTNFLHDGSNLNHEGYAIHGSPWHRWSETVTRRETLRRYSNGCINLPNWNRQIGDYNLPVDEFIFRWIGGFPDPAHECHHTRTNQPVRIYSANNLYQTVFEYTAPDSVRVRGGNWNDVLHAFDAKDIDAPESFFEPTLL